MSTESAKYHRFYSALSELHGLLFLPGATRFALAPGFNILRLRRSADCLFLVPVALRRLFIPRFLRRCAGKFLHGGFEILDEIEEDVDVDGLRDEGEVADGEGALAVLFARIS